SRAIRQAEVGAAKTMIERTEECFGLKPERLAADTAYGSAATLNWLVNEKKIQPHIPVFDKSNREDGTFSRRDFTFDKEHDIYTCPAGKTLATTGTIINDDQLLYRASKFDCDVCPLKMRCCPKAPARKIPRSIHEDARDAVCSLEAHFTAWPSAITRPPRRQRRVPVGGHRSEPQTPRRVHDPTTSTGSHKCCGGIACGAEKGVHPGAPQRVNGNIGSPWRFQAIKQLGPSLIAAFATKSVNRRKPRIEHMFSGL